MHVQSRIAKRVLAEHRAIARRLYWNSQAVLGYAMNNVERWARDFDPPRRPVWLVAWEQLLMGPVEALVAALTADCEAAAQLRARSPFIGFLTPQERIEILSSVDAGMAQAVEAFRNGWTRYFPPAAELAARSRACASNRKFAENIHIIGPGSSGNGSTIKPMPTSILTRSVP